MSWIFKSPLKDFSFFYFPGLVALLLARFVQFDANSVSFLIFSWIAVGLLDSGHVYTTLWRTYFHKEERARRPYYYILVPLIIFLGFLVWIWSGGFLLGDFIIYYTVYHNFKQFYGMSRWYQKLENSYSLTSNLFLWALCFLAFLVLHFKSLNFTYYYALDGVFLYENLFLSHLISLFFYLILLAWFIYEYTLYKKTSFFPKAKIFSIAFPVLLYGTCFMYGNDIVEILFPLVVSHGLSYIALMNLSTTRLKNFSSSYWPLILVLMTALVFGTYEFFFEDQLLNIKDSTKALTGALFLTPLFTHYILDSYIWKSNHPDSKKIAAR